MKRLVSPRDCRQAGPPPGSRKAGKPSDNVVMSRWPASQAIATTPLGHPRAPSVTKRPPASGGKNPWASRATTLSIENFRELRAELAEDGVKFLTETDTETLRCSTRKYMAED